MSSYNDKLGIFLTNENIGWIRWVPRSNSNLTQVLAIYAAFTFWIRVKILRSGNPWIRSVEWEWE